MDNTGVPHILEHTVLCGSQKFPCRDPFFKMLTRSLATFMNAFTSSDWTMYPFSTQNPKDFENLLSVYLDAVFFPKLNELDFLQEGWRLEHNNVNDANSPVVFKGVVFNEMKGAFASPDQLYAQYLQNKLYPSHTYSYISGGEPILIPDLSWEKLKHFHSVYYHPSNARFFTYGDMPLERHLELIGSLALEKFSHIDAGTQVPDEMRWTSPKSEVVRCAPDKMAANPEKQTIVSISYLLNSITDTFEALTLSILGSLLTNGPTSPFYQALIESNIGSDFSPGTGYHGNAKEASFSVGLQGISEDDVSRVLDMIENTFDSVIRDGFPAERIEAILHMIELGLKHQTVNFGLNLCVGLASVSNHDGEPIESIMINKKVSQFKECLAENPNFLKEKVQQYFKDNQHKLILTMKPKDDYLEERKKLEEEKLRGRLEKLSGSEKAAIFEKGKQLAELQSKQEDASSLPTLKIGDIERKREPTVLSHLKLGDVSLQLCEQPTNGVSYFRAFINTEVVPDELKPYLPIFCDVVTKMGAGKMDFRQLAQEIELKTGGLSVSNIITDHHSDIATYEQGVMFFSFCLDRNITDMFNLWSDIFNSVHLSDMDRLMTLIRMSAAELSMELPVQGHRYAMGHAASCVIPAAHLREKCGGLAHVQMMKQIAEMEDVSPVLEKLKMISDMVLNKQQMRCAINVSPDSSEVLLNSTEKFLQSLPENSRQEGQVLTKAVDYKPQCAMTHFELPLPVNFVGKCIQTVPYCHVDSAALQVLSRLMQWKYLHREIREKGGAYGGGALQEENSAFLFYSYRDPHSLETVKNFDESVNWACQGNFTENDVDEAKLFVFQQIDKPVAPGDKGMTYFIKGVTDEMKQVSREQLFAVNKEKVVDAANRYLSAGKQPSAISFLGPENQLTKDNQDWTVIRTQ